MKNLKMTVYGTIADMMDVVRETLDPVDINDLATYIKTSLMDNRIYTINDDTNLISALSLRNDSQAFKNILHLIDDDVVVVDDVDDNGYITCWLGDIPCDIYQTTTPQHLIERHNLKHVSLIYNDTVLNKSSIISELGVTQDDVLSCVPKIDINYSLVLNKRNGERRVYNLKATDTEATSNFMTRDYNYFMLGVNIPSNMSLLLDEVVIDVIVKHRLELWRLLALRLDIRWLKYAWSCAKIHLSDNREFGSTCIMNVNIDRDLLLEILDADAYLSDMTRIVDVLLRLAPDELETYVGPTKRFTPNKVYRCLVEHFKKYRINTLDDDEKMLYLITLIGSIHHTGHTIDRYMII